MEHFALVITYFAYVFVVSAYYYKVRKYFKMPQNLRWELYPVLHEKNYRYGGSYFEELDWSNKTRKKNMLPSIVSLIKKYLIMGSYFEKKRGYWFGLYPWHMGFILIVLFDALVVLDAIFVEAGGWHVERDAGGGAGFLYNLTLVVGLISFTIGCFGSILMALHRLFDENLREYATPQNYINYLFFLAMFATGWAAFAEAGGIEGFIAFWVGVITASTFSGIQSSLPFIVEEIGVWEWTHIVIFAVFLIYLPLTRSTHYITKILYYFWVLSGDTPNLGKGEDDEKLGEYLNYEPSWSAVHHQTGGTWAERATTLPDKEKDK
jgi:nitrate reductase gamma subunit